MRVTSHVLAAASVLAALTVMAVSAPSTNVRVRGTIESVDGNTVMVKGRDGTSMKLVLKNDARIAGVVKAKLEDVKGSANVAITSRPRPDGTLQAVELRIAP